MRSPECPLEHRAATKSSCIEFDYRAVKFGFVTKADKGENNKKMLRDSQDLRLKIVSLITISHGPPNTPHHNSLVPTPIV